MAEVKLLTFDLDDTLWDVRPVIVKAEQEVNNYLSEYCPEIFNKFSATDLISKRLEIYKQRADLRHQISQLRIESIRTVLLECGYKEAEALQRANEAFQVFIDARHDIEYFRDTENVLANLSNNFKLGALTNGNADVFRLSIGRYFDFSIRAEDINSSKPAAKHFEEAITRSGFNAEEIIHIGDHPKYDVLAAKELGFKTVWVNLQANTWEKAARPDAQVQSLAALPDVIFKLSQCHVSYSTETKA